MVNGIWGWGWGWRSRYGNVLTEVNPFFWTMTQFYKYGIDIHLNFLFVPDSLVDSKVWGRLIALPSAKVSHIVWSVMQPVSPWNACFLTAAMFHCSHWPELCGGEAFQVLCQLLKEAHAIPASLMWSGKVSSKSSTRHISEEFLNTASSIYVWLRDNTHITQGHSCDYDSAFCS